MLRLEVPMSLPSRGNPGSATWRDRHKLVKRQGTSTWSALVTHSKYKGDEWLPCDVLLVRVAPRPLDDDNLRQSLKACRDCVADWLSLPNDRDPRVRWCYGQAVDAKKRPRYQALRLVIAPREDVMRPVPKVLADFEDEA